MTASVPLSSNTTLDVCITNGGMSPIGDVEILDVRQAPSQGAVGWRLNPSITPNAKAACILQPQETLTAKVQLIDPLTEPVRPALNAKAVIVFGFRDTDGQWWRDGQVTSAVGSQGSQLTALTLSQLLLM